MLSFSMHDVRFLYTSFCHTLQYIPLYSLFSFCNILSLLFKTIRYYSEDIHLFIHRLIIDFHLYIFLYFIFVMIFDFIIWFIMNTLTIFFLIKTKLHFILATTYIYS
jgi:hypothetical protein